MGEKIWFRLARDASEKEFVRLGGQLDISHPTTLVAIPATVARPAIRLTDSDVDLMRVAVASYDAVRRTFEEAGLSEPKKVAEDVSEVEDPTLRSLIEMQKVARLYESRAEVAEKTLRMVGERAARLHEEREHYHEKLHEAEQALLKLEEETLRDARARVHKLFDDECERFGAPRPPDGLELHDVMTAIGGGSRPKE